jgi:hypothetical protein
MMTRDMIHHDGSHASVTFAGPHGRQFQSHRHSGPAGCGHRLRDSVTQAAQAAGTRPGSQSGSRAISGARGIPRTLTRTRAPDRDSVTPSQSPSLWQILSLAAGRTGGRRAGKCIPSTRNCRSRDRAQLSSSCQFRRRDNQWPRPGSCSEPSRTRAESARAPADSGIPRAAAGDEHTGFFSNVPGIRRRRGEQRGGSAADSKPRSPTEPQH